MASLTAANAVPEMPASTNSEIFCNHDSKSGSRCLGADENVPENPTAQGCYEDSSWEHS